MNPIFRYFIVALMAGASGLLAGAWITRITPAEPGQENSAELSATIRYSQPPWQEDDVEHQVLKLDDIYRQNNIFDQLHFAYTIASASDFEQLSRHLAIVIRSHDPLFSHNIASIFLEKMVVLDPLATLEFIDSHRTMAQNSFITHVLTSWIRQDPEAAIDYFRSMKNKQLKYIIGARLLEDPTLRQNNLIAEIELQLGSRSEQVREQIRLKRMPAANAFEDALLRTDHRRLQLMMRAIGRWYQEDPEAAMQRIAVLTNQSERRQLLSVIMSMQSRQDPELALEMLAQYAPDDKNLMRQALQNYASQDPERALPRIESWVAETGNYNVMNNLLSRWVQIDDVAALSYLESIPEQHRQAAIRNLATSYISHSPEKGMNWLLSLGPEYDPMTIQMAVNGLSRYPEIAEDWLQRLDAEPELQGALLTQVAQRRANSSPSDAYEWLDQYSDSPQFESARNSVLQVWARTEPQEVADLLEGRSDDTSYNHLFIMTASTWASRDADAALSWIESLPDSANRDAALDSAIARIPDPNQAIPLLDKLSGNTARETRMRFARNWLSRSPGEAETIISRLDLDSEDAENLRRTNNQQLTRIRQRGSFR